MTLHKSQDERRRDILDAALKRFVTDGYSGARLNDIARDAGLSKGGVYFHFKSKREIFDALLDRDIGRITQALDAMDGLTGDVAAALGFFARASMAAAAANPDVAKFSVIMGEMAITDEDVRGRLVDVHERFVDRIKVLLRSGVEAGQIDPALDLDAAARLLKSVTDGLRVSIAAGLNDGVDMNSVIDRGAGVLMSGLSRHLSA